MTQVTVGKLKHGKVPVSQVRDATVRDALMKITENQVSAGERTKTLERAMVELQGRLAGAGSRGGAAEYWANKAKESEEQARFYAQDANASKDVAVLAKADANASKDAAVAAKDAAVSAKDAAVEAKNSAESVKDAAVAAKDAAVSAKDAAVEAKNSAESVKDAAVAAKDAAESAKADAESARDEAKSYASSAFARYTPLGHNLVFANNSSTNAAFIPMSLFAWDNEKMYDVNVKFVYWYRYTPKITSNVRHFLVGEYRIDQTSGVQTEVKFVRSSISPSASAPIVTGCVETLTLENVSPASYLAFINGSTTSITDESHNAAGLAYWDVYIYIKEHSAS